MIMRAEEHSCTHSNSHSSEGLVENKKSISGSVLARNAIPVLHSCAAMLKIAEMEYSGANSIFIRLEKLKNAQNSLNLTIPWSIPTF